MPGNMPKMGTGEEGVSKIRRVHRGWVPQSETIAEIMAWAAINRFPPETRADCLKYHGKKCKPVRASIEIIAKKGE